MQINKYHGNYNLSKRNGSIQYICVHYTAGTGSALNNCKYFAGGNRNASADYFIDDAGIWEYNDPASGYYTWAVGDGGGKYGITNANSVNIEVVNTGGAFTEKQIGYLTELVSHLMATYGVPASRVVRHYDASRKSCPLYYVDASRWNALHARITGGSAQWINDGGWWWYRHADGSCTKNGWEYINGNWYLFDGDGWMCTGWNYRNGHWYYLDPSGRMLTGWQWINGYCYFLADDGVMQTGWQNYYGTWYWCHADGHMAVSEWQKIDGEWYYLGSGGEAFCNGWYWIDGKCYYFYDNCVMAHDTYIGDYYVGSDGAWA